MKFINRAEPLLEGMLICRVFKGVRQLHPATDVGVFFCGPKPLGHALHLKCNEWSQPGKDGTHFTFGKENF